MLFRSLASLERFRGHAVWTEFLNQDCIVVDGGAHRGEFSDIMNTRYGCKCILVEANPSLSEKLSPSDDCRVIHAALGPADGMATFRFHKNLEAGGVHGNSKDANGPSVEVNVISLESLMQRFELNRIDLLKLDIEGSEFDLIEQTPDHLLASISQVTIEFHDFLPAFAKQGLFERARERLESLGFVCCRMTFRSNGDVLFVNQRRLGIAASQLRKLSYAGRWILKFRERFAN